MKESEGNDVSVWEPKRLRGSVPVEENSETSPGWTEEENMAAWVWGPALPCKISLARRHASIEKMQRAEMPSSRAVACRREDHIDAHLGG